MSISFPSQQEPAPEESARIRRAVKGLTFRAGEVSHKITELSKSIQSKNLLFQLLSKIGLTYDAKVKRSLVKEQKELNKMLSLLNTEKTASSASLLKTVTNDLEAINKQKQALQKRFSLAVKLNSLAQAGLMKSDPAEKSVIHQMDVLEAQAKGLQHELSRIKRKIANELAEQTLTDFIDTHETTDFTGLNKKQLANQLLEKLHDSLEKPIPTSVSCSTLRQKRKEALPLSALEDSSVVRWYASINDFKACLSTLGRRAIADISLDSVPLKDVEAEQSLYQGCARVATVASQLEEKIVAKWPKADANEVKQLVADTVTLMAIDYNQSSALSFLGLIFSNLGNDAQFVAGERIQKDYSLTLGEGDIPSCTVTFTANFKRIDTDETYNVTTTFSRSIHDAAYEGSITFKLL